MADYVVSFEITVQFEAGSEEKAEERATDMENAFTMDWGKTKTGKPKAWPRWIGDMEFESFTVELA
jgi:hypothetical protein